MEINIETLFKCLRVGIILFLLIIIASIVWSQSSLIVYLEDAYGLVKINKINRSFEVASVLVFLFAVGISNRMSGFAATVGLVCVMFLLSFYVVGYVFWNGALRSNVHVNSETVQYGLPIALLVFILAYKMPRLMTNLVFGGMSFILLLAPWFYQLLPKLVAAIPFLNTRKIIIRVEIWDAVAKMVVESPIFGYGIDSARYLHHVEVESVYVDRFAVIHPHNMVLQLWLDLGFIGVAIVFALLVLGWMHVRRFEATTLPPILAGLTMLTLFMIVSHSIWQTWSIALTTIFVTLISLSYALAHTKRQ